MSRDHDAKEARAGERDALDRAGKAEGQLAALRDELARLRHTTEERDRLSQRLMDLEDQTEKERRHAAARAAGLEAELAEARKAERTALVRAERTEGEGGALREQMAQLTAALRDKSAGAAERKGPREPS